MGDLTKAQEKFPSLYRAWIDYGRPELEKTALGAYVASFLKDGIDFEIEQVDQSLQVLLRRFDVVALKDPLSALFGATNENQRERTSRPFSDQARDPRQQIGHARGRTCPAIMTSPNARSSARLRLILSCSYWPRSYFRARSRTTGAAYVQKAAWCIAPFRSRSRAPLFPQGCETGTACPHT